MKINITPTEISFNALDKLIKLSCDTVDFTTIPPEIIDIAVGMSVPFTTSTVTQGKPATFNLPPLPDSAIQYLRNEFKWRHSTNEKVGEVTLKGESLDKWNSGDTDENKYILPFTAGKESWLQYRLLEELGADFVTFYCVCPNEAKWGPIRETFFNELTTEKYLFRINHRFTRLQYFGIPLLLSYLTGARTCLLGSDVGHHTDIAGSMRYYGLTPLWQRVVNKLMYNLFLPTRYSSLVSCLPPGAVVTILTQRYGDTWKKIHSLPYAEDMPNRIREGTFWHGKFHRVCAFLIANKCDPNEIGMNPEYFWKMVCDNPEWIIENGKERYRDDIAVFLNPISKTKFMREGWGDCIITDKVKYVCEGLREEVMNIYLSHLLEYNGDLGNLTDENYDKYYDILTEGL